MNNPTDWKIVALEEGRDPTDVKDQLVAAGIDAEVVIRVRADQAEDARRVLSGIEEDADPSADLDLETVAVFQGADAEMQAAAVEGLLEGSGISVIVEGAYGMPSLPFEIRVARKRAAAARQVLADAEAVGAEAEASEAEAEAGPAQGKDGA